MTFADYFWLAILLFGLLLGHQLLIEGGPWLWDRLLSFGDDGTVETKLKILRRKRRVNTIVLVVMGAAASAAVVYWAHSIEIAFYTACLAGVFVFVVRYQAKKDIAQLNEKQNQVDSPST